MLVDPVEKVEKYLELGRTNKLFKKVVRRVEKIEIYLNWAEQTFFSKNVNHTSRESRNII